MGQLGVISGTILGLVFVQLITASVSETRSVSKGGSPSIKEFSGEPRKDYCDCFEWGHCGDTSYLITDPCFYDYYDVDDALAAWVITIIIVGVVIFLSVIIISICFCCACCCFSGRKARGGAVHTYVHTGPPQGPGGTQYYGNQGQAPAYVNAAYGNEAGAGRFQPPYPTTGQAANQQQQPTRY